MNIVKRGVVPQKKRATPRISTISETEWPHFVGSFNSLYAILRAISSIVRVLAAKTDGTVIRISL